MIQNVKRPGKRMRCLAVLQEDLSVGRPGKASLRGDSVELKAE